MKLADAVYQQQFRYADRSAWRVLGLLINYYVLRTTLTFPGHSQFSHVRLVTLTICTCINLCTRIIQYDIQYAKLVECWRAIIVPLRRRDVN